MMQGAFTGTFTPPWLLEECRSTLTRIAKSGKPQAMLAAGALAGLSGVFSACEVCSSPSGVSQHYFLMRLVVCSLST